MAQWGSVPQSIRVPPTKSGTPLPLPRPHLPSTMLSIAHSLVLVFALVTAAMAAPMPALDEHLEALKTRVDWVARASNKVAAKEDIYSCCQKKCAFFAALKSR